MVLVARALPTDAQEMLDLLERVAAETDFLGFIPGNVGITLAQQVAFLGSLDDPAAGATLKAVVDGAIAGTAGIKRGTGPRFRHAGEVGISVLRRYWGKGVGRALMEGIVKEGQRIGLERLSLRVRADNARAIALYESIGFLHEGRLVGAFAVGQARYDDLQMGLLFAKPPRRE